MPSTSGSSLSSSQHSLSQAPPHPARWQPSADRDAAPPGIPKPGTSGSLPWPSPEPLPKGFRTNKPSGWLQTAPEQHRTNYTKLEVLCYLISNKAIVVKRACYWYKNRHIEQLNRTGKPGINPIVYGQVFYHITELYNI